MNTPRVHDPGLNLLLKTQSRPVNEKDPLSGVFLKLLKFWFMQLESPLGGLNNGNDNRAKPLHVKTRLCYPQKKSSE